MRTPSITDDGRWRSLGLIVLLGIGQAAGLGTAAYATRVIFKALHDGSAPGLTAFALLSGGLLAVPLCQAVSRVLAEDAGQSFAKRIRRDLYKHLAGMNAEALERRRFGALSLRFVGDLSAARKWAGLGIARAITCAIVLPAAVLALVLFSPMLAIAVMGPLLLALVVAAALAIRLPASHQRLRTHRARLATAALERLAIATRLDIAGRSRREIASLGRRADTVRREARSRAARMSAILSLPQVGSAFGAAAILGSAYSFGLAAADAAAALAILGIVTVPLREATGVWDRYCAWQIARTKLDAVLSEPSKARRPKRVGHAVSLRFDDVRRHDVHVDLAIPAGAVVLVTGPPASGKSTLLSLSAGHLHPQSGDVSYGTARRRPMISFITERPVILQGSLRRNLCLGAADRPNDEELQTIIECLGLSALVTRLGGFDGRLAESGRTVSAAEALRIELARTILMQPDLIIVDHARFASCLRADAIAAFGDRCHATVLFSGEPDEPFCATHVLALPSEAGAAASLRAVPSPSPHTAKQAA